MIIVNKLFFEKYDYHSCSIRYSNCYNDIEILTNKNFSLKYNLSQNHSNNKKIKFNCIKFNLFR